MKIDLNNLVFKKISEVSSKTGIDSYVVGGYVRDYILGISNDDIDIVVVGSGTKFAREFASLVGSFVQIYENYGTAKVNFNSIEVEFVGARKESYQRGSRNPIVEEGTLEDDLLRRDFTINALAASLCKNNFGEVIDLFGGLSDLKNGLLRTPSNNPNITFSDDPLRMLRCFRFMSKLDFRIFPETLKGIHRNIDRIKIISQERITTELNKLILGNNPMRAIELMESCGLLRYILPELSDLNEDGGPGEYHHKNNFIHSIKVLDNISKRSDNLWLRWAALLHDIGKKSTMLFDSEKGWTFYDHEHVGARMIEPLFRRLKQPLGKELDYVKTLVDMHMRPSMISTKEISDSAVRRLLNDAGDYIEDLICLCECDLTTKSEEKRIRVGKHFKRLKEMLKDLIEKDYKRLFQPCISGNDIMNYFGLRPCKEVGIIKEELKNAILDGNCPNEVLPLTKLMIDIYNKVKRIDWPSFPYN